MNHYRTHHSSNSMAWKHENVHFALYNLSLHFFLAPDNDRPFSPNMEISENFGLLRNAPPQSLILRYPPWVGSRHQVKFKSKTRFASMHQNRTSLHRRMTNAHSTALKFMPQLYRWIHVIITNQMLKIIASRSAYTDVHA